MTHAETVRRSYLLTTEVQEEIDAAVRRVTMRMNLDGLSNVQVEVTQYHTGDCELFATGDRLA